MTKVQTSANLQLQFIKGGSIVFAFVILATPLGYFLRMIFSRNLSIEMYGLLYAMISFIGVFSTYNDFGFGYALSYLTPKYFKRKKLQICWSLFQYEKTIELVSATVLALGLWYFSDALATYYFKVPEAKTVLLVFCVYFIGNSYVSALHKLFVGLRQELFHSSIQPIVLLVTLIGSALGVVFGLTSVVFFAACWAAGYVVTALIYSWLNKHVNPALVSQTVVWSTKLLKEMSRYALPSIINSTVFTFISYMDTFYLTLFHGVAAVGLFNIILPLAAIPAIIFTPLENFLYPHISHFAEGEKEKIVVLAHHSQKIVILSSLYFGIFIALYPAAIIGTLFGPQWWGATEFGLRLYASTFVIFGLANHYGMIISGMGRVKERLKITAVLAAINVIGGGIAIYAYGVPGAIITNIAINSLGLVLFMILIRRDIAISLPWSYLVRSLAVVIITVLAMLSLAIDPLGVLNIIKVGLIYTGIFTCFALAFKLSPFNISFLLSLRQSVSKMK